MAELLARAIADSLETSWHAKARPNQLPPADPWTIWLVLAGRGWGKTATGAHWVVDRVTTGRAQRVALVAPTAADARDIMVEGLSGVLASSPSWCRPEYEPSKRRLTWPNGATATTFSADEPERLRGPQFAAAWCGELAVFRRPQAWDMLMFGLRLGNNPQCVVTTTPRATKLIRELLGREDCVVTRGSSYENRANLAPEFFVQIVRKYEGTRLGRQELFAELLDDVPGALWTRDRLEELRREIAPPFRRIVVAIDPSGTEEGDESGIVAVGQAEDDRAYVLADASGQLAPPDWARRAIGLYRDLRADRVVAEVNYGGQMVESVLRMVDPGVAFTSVTASRGKVARAEPVAALYEQGRVHHLGCFPELEDQMCSFTTAFDRKTAGFSPGRVDALVWAITDLMVAPMKGANIFEVYRQMAAEHAGQRPAIADTRVEWKRRFDEMCERETPGHPDVDGGEVEYVNGPNCKPTYAIGSLEWAQLKTTTG